MTAIELKQFKTGKLLFKGDFTNIAEALEDAVQKKIKLDGVIIENTNLDDACLDEAMLNRAVFYKCSLRHADMSEGSYNNTRFIDCDLSGACLAHSAFKQTCFIETPMVKADMAGAWIENIVFSCPSVLDLNFSECTEFRNSVYIHEGKMHCLLTKQPITIKGLHYPITLMHEHIKVGCIVKKYNELEALRPETIQRVFGHSARDFSADYIPFLQTASRLASTHAMHNYKKLP